MHLSKITVFFISLLFFLFAAFVIYQLQILLACGSLLVLFHYFFIILFLMMVQFILIHYFKIINVRVNPIYQISITFLHYLLIHLFFYTCRELVHQIRVIGQIQFQG